MNLKSRVYTALYGGILGDALGVPYEFCERGGFSVQGMIGGGTYSLPPGTWSDDTSLTLCLIENITEKGTTASLLDRFQAWLEQGKYTPHGVAFDVGTGTQNAILRYKCGMPPHLCGGSGERDNGNGSLMRIAPLAFVLHNTADFILRAETVKRYSEITHRHPRSVLACIIYIELLIEILKGRSLGEALQTACSRCQTDLAGTVYEKEVYHYSRVFNGSIRSASRAEIKSTGYVVHTLEAALWSCFNSIGLQETLCTAVNLGDDTDTVGTVAGTIAGMQCRSTQELPENWMHTIVRKNKIDKMIRDFYEYITCNT